MKRTNIFSLLALICIGVDGNTLIGLPVTTQKPRPSKYLPSHPVAIELMAKAQAKRDRKKQIADWNDHVCKLHYYRTQVIYG